MAKLPIDLSQLAMNRLPVNSDLKKSRHFQVKRVLARYALPAAILTGFLALVIAAAGNHLMPMRSVTIMPVVVKKVEGQPAGSDLFQAPGWIEPRPMAVSVAAMAPGVIEELMVVAGQKVEKGDAIAKLVSVDAELSLEQSKNTLAIRQGEIKGAEAELLAARIRVEDPVHLRVQLADAQSNLAKAKTELGKLPYLIEAADANVKYARVNLDGKRSARNAIAEIIITQAENEYAIAIASLNELEQRKPNLEREVQAFEDVVTSLKHQLKLLVEEHRQFSEAEAKVQSAVAYLNEAKLQVRLAELALDRNTIRAPMSGRILRLVASPGTRVMGLEANAGQSSSTVVEMYDPQTLQVRADVRLEDVPLVSQGQPVKIETASAPGEIRGRVLNFTSSANIQKNTLEVKVEILDPPAAVSPEMLVTTTFQAPANEALASSTSEKERIFVPRQLLQSSENLSYIWIIDEHSIARKRTLELDGKGVGELIAVKSGLRVTDKLITNGLDGMKDGTRVRVTGTDLTIGIH